VGCRRTQSRCGPRGGSESPGGRRRARTFMDPSEAVFVMLGEQRALVAYPDLRGELLLRTIEDAANDPHPGFSAEEVFAEIAVKLAAP
jgi:hypothetical protein